MNGNQIRTVGTSRASMAAVAGVDLDAKGQIFTNLSKTELQAMEKILSTGRQKLHEQVRDVRKTTRNLLVVEKLGKLSDAISSAIDEQELLLLEPQLFSLDVPRRVSALLECTQDPKLRRRLAAIEVEFEQADEPQWQALHLELEVHEQNLGGKRRSGANIDRQAVESKMRGIIHELLDRCKDQEVLRRVHEISNGLAKSDAAQLLMQYSELDSLMDPKAGAKSKKSAERKTRRSRQEEGLANATEFARKQGLEAAQDLLDMAEGMPERVHMQQLRALIDHLNEAGTEEEIEQVGQEVARLKEQMGTRLESARDRALKRLESVRARTQGMVMEDGDGEVECADICEDIKWDMAQTRSLKDLQDLVEEVNGMDSQASLALATLRGEIGGRIKELARTAPKIPQGDSSEVTYAQVLGELEAQLLASKTYGQLTLMQESVEGMAEILAAIKSGRPTIAARDFLKDLA